MVRVLDINGNLKTITVTTVSGETDPVWLAERSDYLKIVDAASQYAALSHTHSFASITSKPTTIAGYGITDYNTLWDTRLATKSTTNLTEGTNLYFTQARVRATPITGFVSGAGTVLATDTILQAIQKLDGNIGAGVTAAALTKVDDTNVTLTLGGTPATSLLQAVSLTLGWTGTLADARIASAATWNAKQDALIGTGFVKSTAGVISYDNSTYLTTVSAASSYQPLDSDLTTIAGLTATTNNFIVSVAGAWASRTPTQVKATLAIANTDVSGLGTLSTQNGTFSGTSSGTNTGDQTSVSGNAGTATALATARKINGVSFDGTADIAVSNKILAYQAMGSTIIATNVDGDLSSGTIGQALVDARVYFSAVYLDKAQTVTGVKWVQITAGDYTADAYNGVGLYSYSGGTMTLVASSTNDGNIWKATSGTMSNKAFSSTYAASAGLYFVAFLYNNSAQVTAPSVGIINTASTINTITDFTNSARTSALLSSQASLPSPQTMSGTTAASTEYKMFLY